MTAPADDNIEAWRTAVGLVVQLSRGHRFEAEAIIVAAIADGEAAALLEVFGWLALGLAGDAFRLEGAELEALLLTQASALREVGQ